MFSFNFKNYKEKKGFHLDFLRKWSRVIKPRPNVNVSRHSQIYAGKEREETGGNFHSCVRQVNRRKICWRKWWDSAPGISSLVSPPQSTPLCNQAKPFWTFFSKRNWAQKFREGPDFSVYLARNSNSSFLCNWVGVMKDWDRITLVDCFHHRRAHMSLPCPKEKVGFGER